VSSVASALTALGSAANGDRVCLADGSYGAVSLSTHRSGYATLAAAHPGAATLGKVTVAGNASHVAVSDFKVTGGFSFQGGASDIQVLQNLMQGSGGVNFVAAINPIPGGCCSVSNFPLIQHILIDGNKFLGPYGEDAMQLDGFNDVTVSNNEITNVTSVNGAHADGLQTVHGGSNLHIVGNYMHDNNMQPLFIGKDGDITNLEIRQNLSVRDRVGASPTQVLTQILQPHHVVIENNTFADEGGLDIEWAPDAYGGNNPPPGAPVDAKIDHNAFSEFLPYDYSASASNRAGVFENSSVMTENYNVMGKTASWTWAPGRVGSCSVATDATPAYSNPATDDYRLNVSACGGYAAGVTWRPADRQFGPR
jgi:hypothetical protein